MTTPTLICDGEDAGGKIVKIAAVVLMVHGSRPGVNGFSQEMSSPDKRAVSDVATWSLGG